MINKKNCTTSVQVEALLRQSGAAWAGRSPKTLRFQGKQSVATQATDCATDYLVLFAYKDKACS